jgi:methylase of polypeptide subunit release factors
VVETIELAQGLGRSGAPQSGYKRFVRNVTHFLSYHFILNRRRTTVVRAAGFELTVRHTVFHPRIFLTSEFFAAFVARLDLKDKRVADVGTGSGIIALAAARAGAASVVAVDINPNAARSALAPRAQFDIILSNPPYFPDEPLDLADRAWNAGPGYRDIAPLFEQARARLAPGGSMYLLISSESDFGLLGALIERAGFRARPVQERSILIESLVIYELRPK